MLKKVLILPFMAFALLTLSGATVTEDGEDIFEWEVIDESTSLPSESADSEEVYSSTNYDFNTVIYDNDDTLDIYLGSNSDSSSLLYYNYNDNYSQYSESNKFQLGVDFKGSQDIYIHIEIYNYEPGLELSFIGGPLNEGVLNDDAPHITTLDTFGLPAPTVLEEIGGALSTIVTAGSAVFVSTFDGLWDVFWDADANDGDGALNWIAYVAVLPVGFFLVRWAFRKVLGMIQQRL